MLGLVEGIGPNVNLETPSVLVYLHIVIFVLKRVMYFLH